MVETSECRQCGQQIFWHKSKAGKNYPANSEDRRDFHQCQPKPATPPAQPSTPPLRTHTTAPANDLNSQVKVLENAVRSLFLRVDAIEKEKSNVPF
jgi:hypothetical protein